MGAGNSAQKSTKYECFITVAADNRIARPIAQASGYDGPHRVPSHGVIKIGTKHTLAQLKAAVDKWLDDELGVNRRALRMAAVQAGESGKPKVTLPHKLTVFEYVFMKGQKVNTVYSSFTAEDESQPASFFANKGDTIKLRIEMETEQWDVPTNEKVARLAATGRHTVEIQEEEALSNGMLDTVLKRLNCGCERDK